MALVTIDAGLCNGDIPLNSLLMASTAMPECMAIKGRELAHPSLTAPNALGVPLRRRSLRLGRYQLFAVIAFSAWMSSACSVNHQPKLTLLF